MCLGARTSHPCPTVLFDPDAPPRARWFDMRDDDDELQPQGPWTDMQNGDDYAVPDWVQQVWDGDVPGLSEYESDDATGEAADEAPTQPMPDNELEPESDAETLPYPPQEAASDTDTVMESSLALGSVKGPPDAKLELFKGTFENSKVDPPRTSATFELTEVPLNLQRYLCKFKGRPPQNLRHL